MTNYENDVMELSITVKGESSKLIERHLIYGPYHISKCNDDLASKVKDAMFKFKLEDGEPPSIVIKTKTIWQ